jgi:high-affinity iron transporter
VVLGGFLIFTREGIEGTMICAILLTFLAAANRRDMFRWVFLGAGAAVVAAAIAGVALWVASRDAFVGSDAQAWEETAVFLLAVAMLTYMTFWMRRHARSIGRELRERMQGAVKQRTGWPLFTIAFVTVGREAIETVIFTLAIAYATSALQLGIGAALGLALALGIAFAMYRVGVRVNLGRFFAVMGSLLMVVAAGLLADAVQNLQQLGVLPGSGLVVWNTYNTLPDDSGVGDVLHGLLGYSAQPTVLMLACWALFLGIGLTLFLRQPRPAPRRLPA